MMQNSATMREFSYLFGRGSCATQVSLSTVWGIVGPCFYVSFAAGRLRGEDNCIICIIQFTDRIAQMSDPVTNYVRVANNGFPLNVQVCQVFRIFQAFVSFRVYKYASEYASEFANCDDGCSRREGLVCCAPRVW